MPKLSATDREGAEKQFEAATGVTLMKAIRNNGFDEMMALCGGAVSARPVTYSSGLSGMRRARSFPALASHVLAHVLTAGAALVPLAQRTEHGHARLRLR